MVVGGMLRHVAHKLGHLHVVLELPLEASEQDLPLAGLEAVDHGWDGSGHVRLGEEHQLLVHEVLVAHLLLRVVNEPPLLVGVDPRLPVIRPLLVEGQVNELVVASTGPLEEHPVISDVLEVFLSLLGSRGAQAFVVLGRPSLAAVALLLPGFVVHHAEELQLLRTFRDLNDWRDELLHEALQLEERRPPVLKHVQQQPLDVRAIIILICHDHDAAIA
mmetsp:Transcript_21100/g.49106  ORF Transcript_21100/g.49106 Transcript_21100/m.49106 type:complete len:218 (-) Transcript_21100:1586-2239(-)